MTPEMAHDAALRKRAQLQADSRAAGIDEAMISEVVERFYAKVRADAELGPIFAQAIGEDWGPHLAKMKVFWGSLTLRTGEYHGNPVAVHQVLSGVRSEHFAAWLQLFEETLRESAPSDEARNQFLTFARSIARRLESVMTP